MAELAIEARDLSKTFPPNVVAVNALDLKAPAGCVYGLIGRNGAGKTTLIRLLMGLLRADRGSARLLGMDMWTATRPQRARVAYVAQAQQLHAWMTVGELCHYAGSFYDKWDRRYARALAKRFELPWERQAGLLSGGQQRKLAVLLAFAARPEVLLLDEPAAGLDPIARRELIDEIIEIIAAGNGTTILLSTHIISDLERIAEIVGIMDRGRIVRQTALADLQSRTRRVQVIFGAAGPPADFTIPGAIRSRTAGAVVTAIVDLTSDTQLDSVRALPGVRVSEFPLGLEDIFIELFAPAAMQELVEQLP